MTKRLLSIVIILFVGVPRVSAQSYFDTGNQLYSNCTSDKSFELGVCIATVSGAYDMMSYLSLACGSPKVTRRQVVDVIVQYLRNNPEKRHQPAATLILPAIAAAFPCNKNAQ
jgi:hypothetical protein